VATLLLVRHGRTAANVSGTLAGWTPGVGLDDTGRAQAGRLAARLRDLPLTEVVSSPLERCTQTAAALVSERHLPVSVDDRLGECRYGDWTGRSLKELAKEPLWKVVQAHPSAVVFPGADGESLRAVSARAVDLVREVDKRVSTSHGPDAVWVAVSHADVIKAALADALGLHLDEFQRIVVDPCSVSVVHYTPLRSFVARVNDTGSLAGLVPPPRRRRKGRTGTSDAVVGGGAGSS
jgi:probable phosphomutase (TIGR03848 family)